MAGQARCRSCNAPVLWVKLVNEKNMPIDTTRQSEPRASLVCVNPSTGRAKVLSNGDVDAAYRWIQAGATLHRSHFMTCPEAKKHRQAKAEAKEQDRAEAEAERVQEKFPDLT